MWIQLTNIAQWPLISTHLLTNRPTLTLWCSPSSHHDRTYCTAVFQYWYPMQWKYGKLYLIQSQRFKMNHPDLEDYFSSLSLVFLANIFCFDFKRLYSDWNIENILIERNNNSCLLGLITMYSISFKMYPKVKSASREIEANR